LVGLGWGTAHLFNATYPPFSAVSMENGAWEDIPNSILI
jgi:hypothetical protein